MPPPAPVADGAMTITVVMPAYNNAEHIAEAIGSVLAQDPPPLELLVIDDGSTDDTVAVAERFGPPVRVIRQANQGSAVARNRGITEARGSHVAFLDADDVWHPAKLRLQREAMARSGRPFCYTQFIRWEPGADGRHAPAAEVFAQASARPPEIAVPGHGHLYPELLLECFVWTSTVLAERQVLVDAGLFDVALRKGQDYDFWLRLSQRIAMVGVTEPTALYRQHGSNITSAMMPVNYEYRVLTQALARWGLASCDGRTASHEAVQARLRRSCLSHGLGHLRRGDPAVAAESLRLAIGHGVRNPKIVFWWLWARLRSLG